MTETTTTDNAAFTQGYLLTSSGNQVEMPEPANADGTYSLQQLQEAVGGYIEILTPVSDLPGTVVLGNEDGLQKRLPLNLAASTLCGFPVVGNIAVVPASTIQ
jgi:hypothetical protein